MKHTRMKLMTSNKNLLSSAPLRVSICSDNPLIVPSSFNSTFSKSINAFTAIIFLALAILIESETITKSSEIK